MDIKLSDIPIIKSFCVNGKNYIYDMGKNQVLHITKEQFIEVQKMLRIGLNDYLSISKDAQAYKDVVQLINKGYFHGQQIYEITHPITKYVSLLMERAVGEMILQVTRDCNFKCRYCLFTRENSVDRLHEKIDMSWDLAQKCIDYLYEHSTDMNDIYISFYGGEPLINFKLIKQVVEYADRLFNTKKIHYATTINGSLLNTSIIAFCIEHDLSLAISLDGPREIQNNHRRFYETGKGTFDIVMKNVNKIKNMSLKYFEEKVTFQPVVMMDEDKEHVISFFEEIGVKRSKVMIIKASMSGIDYFYSGTKGLSKAKLESDYDFSSDDYDTVLSSKSKIPEVWHHSGPCVPGVRKLFVDVYGNFYPCEKVLENPANIIGDIRQGLNADKVEQMLNIGRLTSDDCKHCWAARFCEICAVRCLDAEHNKLCGNVKRNACEYEKIKISAYLENYIKNRSI